MPSRDDILNAKILIVDDNADNIDLLSEILRDIGYTRVSATMASDTVCALHEKNRYDLILLDLQMPDFDGFQVMDGLREIEQGSYLPVLAVTAQPHFKVQALEAGARDFISKPFDLHEVRQRIYNMLEVRLLYEQLAQYSKAQQMLALHDALTGLPNRRLLEDRLTTALQHAKRSQLKVAVLYLDLDGFKEINDNCGHAGGDALLKLVAQRLISSSRQEDTVARIGGDEFIVVLEQLADGSDALHPAHKLLDIICAPCQISDATVHVSASIGISIYPDDAANAADLIACADGALYQAKRAGKNQLHLSAPARPGSALFGKLVAADKSR